MVTVQLPFTVNGSFQMELKTASRMQYLKRTKQLRLFPDRRAGCDAWSICNEIERQTASDHHIDCSPYQDYAVLSVRW